MSKDINILFTSVGRRSYLIKYFREALGGMGKIYATNSIEHSTAFKYVDDHAVSPLIYSEEYIPFLLDCCKKWDIKAIISLFDIDLMVLAKSRDRFEEIGVKVIVSDTKVIDKCNDKWHTYNYLNEIGLKAPRTYIDLSAVTNDLAKGIISYPVMIKPRWGMGSLAIFEADNEEELKIFYEKSKKEIKNSYLKYESEYDFDKCVLIQEKIKGQEYGLDIINDLDGNYINTIVKKKMGMRSGETDCAVTVDDDRIKEIGKKISDNLKHIANLDTDIFVTENDIYVLEMNARFGGGYPFSHIAGVDLPGAIVSWLSDETIDINILTAKPGILAQKEIEITTL